jgi:elongation factor P
MRNLENGKILENTYTAGERIEILNVERRPYQFFIQRRHGVQF